MDESDNLFIQVPDLSKLLETAAKGPLARTLSTCPYISRDNNSQYPEWH